LFFVLGFIIIKYASWKSRQAALAKEEIKLQKYRNQSLSTKYGQITEQFLPLVECYPYDSRNFRFLGSPIDGVQFEKNKVVLIEFKAANSRMSKRQKHIKALVEAGKVEFRLVRAS